ncbi:MAG: hypothetical protein HY290_08375 [Planctomycetia bacterium]|nr:hypothetical protein [Planctomycetia bacterium]
MKKLIVVLVAALFLPACVKHPPRDPEKVKRSEARKKRVEDKQRRRDQQLRRTTEVGRMQSVV